MYIDELGIYEHYRPRRRKMIFFLMLIWYGIISNVYILSSINVYVLYVIRIVWLCITGYFLGTRKGKISRKQAEIIILLMMLQVITTIVNGVVWGNTISDLVSLIILFYFINNLSEEFYLLNLTDVMAFLCVYSLFTYWGYDLLSGLFNVFPSVTRDSIEYKFTFFSVVPTNMLNYHRNFGFCSEPGRYQIFINFALFAELFMKKKSDLRKVVIFLITIITTYSTQGYIVSVLLILAYLNNRNYEGRKIKKLVLFVTVIIVVIILYLYFNGELANSYVFDKFSGMTKGGSAFERFRAFYLAFDEFLQNPLFGVGWPTHAATYLKGNILTFTILNWAALYGFFYCMICVFGLFYYVLIPCNTVRSKILITITFVAITCAQDMSSSIYLLSMVLFGYKHMHKKIKRIEVNESGYRNTYIS